MNIRESTLFMNVIIGQTISCIMQMQVETVFRYRNEAQALSRLIYITDFKCLPL